MIESVYISYSESGSELASDIASWFQQQGFEIYRSDPILKNSRDHSNTLREKLAEVQIVVFVITREFLDNERFHADLRSEISFLAEFHASSKRVNQLIIPVVDDYVKEDLPKEFHRYNVISFEHLEVEKEKILSKIERVLIAYRGEKAAKEKEESEIKDRIERSSAEYIDETIEELTNRENRLRKIANRWYIAGYTSFLLGIVATILLTIITYKEQATGIDWSEILFWTIKGIVIIILFIAASKYSFELAKTFMNESLKNADRIHAISFGKFYLQVFGKNVKSEEIMNVFQYWNIDKQSNFNGLDSNSFDPKLLEIALEFVSQVKANQASK